MIGPMSHSDPEQLCHVPSEVWYVGERLGVVLPVPGLRANGR